MHKWDSRQRKGTAKKPKLFGEASAVLPWLGLNSMQEAVRASVTHIGRQGQPDVPRQAEQPGPGPQGARQARPPTTLNTQDNGMGPRCSTKNSPVRETWIQILLAYAEFTVTCGQDLDQSTCPCRVTQRHFRPQTSQQLGWWQPTAASLFQDTTAKLLKTATVAAFPFLEILPYSCPYS